MLGLDDLLGHEIGEEYYEFLSVMRERVLSTFEVLRLRRWAMQIFPEEIEHYGKRVIVTYARGKMKEYIGEKGTIVGWRKKWRGKCPVIRFDNGKYICSKKLWWSWASGKRE
jgi:hypothetical protein